MARWKYDDPALLYLYPATYLVHLVEEWWAAPPLALWWVVAVRPLQFVSFAACNGFGLVLMLCGVRLAIRRPRFAWVVPALAGAVLLNTAGHTVGTILTRSYSAGLISGVVLWVPLGLLTLLRVWDQAPRATVWTGIIAAACIETAVVAALSWIAG